MSSKEELAEGKGGRCHGSGTVSSKERENWREEDCSQKGASSSKSAWTDT